MADRRLQTALLPRSECRTTQTGTTCICLPASAFFKQRDATELEDSNENACDACCLTRKYKVDFLSHESAFQLRNPAQTPQCAALTSTSAVSVHVCRKSWKPDRFTEVREDQTINFRNGKLKQSMSPQWMLASDKGSHWDTPTKGRRFNYCNLYFKCNDLRYPS